MAANFKLYFNAEDIRRIRLDTPTWESFRSKLQQLYPQYLPDLAIRYMDEEGDLITITTSREWETMIETSNGVSPIKLFISDAAQPKVQVSVVDHLEENTDVDAQIPEEPKAEAEKPQEQEGLIEEVVDGEKEEPFELVEPSTPAGVGSSVCHTEMDFSVFFERLHQQACSFLNPAENETLRKAKEFFEGLVPEGNPHLAEEISGAVEGVKRAFSDGYSNLKELPEFKELMELLSGAKEDDPKKWASQHDTLQSMGFLDVEENHALLSKYKGNVQRVVNALLAKQ